jgi:hypothetical protein
MAERTLLIGIYDIRYQNATRCNKRQEATNQSWQENLPVVSHLETIVGDRTAWVTWVAWDDGKTTGMSRKRPLIYAEFVVSLARDGVLRILMVKGSDDAEMQPPGQQRP